MRPAFRSLSRAGSLCRCVSQRDTPTQTGRGACRERSKARENAPTSSRVTSVVPHAKESRPGPCMFEKPACPLAKRENRCRSSRANRLSSERRSHAAIAHPAACSLHSTREEDTIAKRYQQAGRQDVPGALRTSRERVPLYVCAFFAAFNRIGAELPALKINNLTGRDNGFRYL